MGAKIDPKVCDVSVRIQNWWMEDSTNRNLSEEFIDEDEPRLSIRIHSKQRFIFTIQYLERLFV